MFIIIGCQRNEIIKTHGISYLEQREKLIVVNKSNKNDTIKVFGQPATKGMTNNNLWIYIERTKTRGKLLKLGRNYLKKTGEFRLSHHIDLKTGLYNGKQILEPKK